jgi:hypothetical protein
MKKKQLFKNAALFPIFDVMRELGPIRNMAGTNFFSIRARYCP